MRTFLKITCCIAILAWASMYPVVNYGYVGRLHWPQYKNLLIVVALVIINVLALLGLQSDNIKWRPAFYILGTIDFAIGIQCIFELPNCGLCFLTAIFCLRGALLISYASRLGTTFAYK